MPTSSGSTASTAAYSTERLGRARARATKKGRSFLRPFSCPGRRQRSVQLGLDVADGAFDLRRGGRTLQLLGQHLAGGGNRHLAGRSEERRVGKECVRTGRSRWSPAN